VGLGHDHAGNEAEDGDRREPAPDQLASAPVALQRRQAEDHGDQQHQRRHHARDQGPAVQSDLPQSPDDGADEDGDIEPGAQRPQQGQKPSGHDHQQADDQIIGGAAQHDQLAPAYGQRQPDQGDDDPQKPDKDAAESTSAL